jgi:hypothetical protein
MRKTHKLLDKLTMPEELLEQLHLRLSCGTNYR